MADPVQLDINSNGTNTIDSTNDIKADLSLSLVQPFQTESSLELKPLTATINDATHLTIDPLQLKDDVHLGIDPLKLELQVDPLKTDSNATLDLKPLVIDFCYTTNIGKIPSLCIRQPYNHHFAFTLFGLEVWGFSYSGEQETVVEEPDRQPKVVWGGARAAARPSAPSPEPAPEPRTREAGGLRIRLGN